MYSDDDEDDDGYGYGYGYHDSDSDEDDYDLFGLRRSILGAVERYGGMQSSRPAPRPRKVTRLEVPMAVLLPGDLDVKGGAAEDRRVKEVRAWGDECVIRVR
jgi:hypothetical protein